MRDLDAAVWHEKKEGEIDYDQCTWGHFDGESTLRYLVRELGKYEAMQPDENPHDLDPISNQAYEMAKLRRLENG